MRLARFSVILFILQLPYHAVSQSDSSKHVVLKLLRVGAEQRSNENVQSALQAYFDALRTAKANGNEWGVVKSSEGISGLYEQYYRYEESVPYLKSTYTYYKKYDSLQRLARVSNNIAWHFIKLNRIDSALLYSEESVHAYRSLPSTPTLPYCIALESLGEIYSLKGQFVRAQEVLNECLNLGMKTKNEVIMGFTYYGLALNEFNQMHYLNAIRYISKCLPLAEKYAQGPLLADVYRLAFRIFEVSGNQNGAYAYLRKYQTLRDSLYTEDVEKKAAIVNANFEIHKKENELKLLGQKNEIQHLEIERQKLLRNAIISISIVLVVVGILIYLRIQGKRKLERQEYERKKAELEQARQMQLSLLPQKPLITKSIEVHGKMQTATEVGGDYFDYFELDSNRFLVVFGDATGHGLTAGIIVSITKAVLVNSLNHLRETNNILDVVSSLNEALIKALSTKGKGMAIQFAIVDIAQQNMTITSCGMPYPMIYDKKRRALEVLEIKQPPLGFLKQLRVSVQVIPLTFDHTLILVSDGILERFNRQKEEYGLARLTQRLEQQLIFPDTPMPALLEDIFKHNDAFADGLANDDDMTGLCLKLTSSHP